MYVSAFVLCLALVLLVHVTATEMPRGRPRKASVDDALAALHALAAPAVAPIERHGEKHMAKMRERKAEYAKERAELELSFAKSNAKSAVAAVAELGNVSVGAQSGSASKLPINPTTGRAGNGRAWNIASILRAAYTPVCAGAYGAVVECGHSSPSDCRSLIARVIMDKNKEGLDALLGQPREEPIPYAVFCKMHDSSK